MSAPTSMPSPSPGADDALEGFLEETQSALMYTQLASIEPDERLSEMFRQLSGAASEQAQLWARRLSASGRPVPAVPALGLRSRGALALARRFGVKSARPVLVALKVRGLSAYDASAPATGHPKAASVADIGRRHRSGGGNLRAAVFGVNDGLVSNASLIMGMAGAAAEPQTLLLAGVAGLLAGAFSMAAGEYVSVRSQREVFEYQIGLERAELQEYPDAEAEELATIYQAKGLARDEAERIARALIADPERALDTLAREELGLNPDELGSPWGAAASSFAAFAVGAAIPLLPFLLSRSPSAFGWAVTLAALSLFAVGALLSWFTGRSALWSGLRMLAIGAAAGAATFLIGKLVGVTIG